MPNQHHLDLDPLQSSLSRELPPREPTMRRAVARGRVVMAPATTDLIASNAMSKGDVLATARVAAIQAAKQAATLLPMCQMVVVGTTVVNFFIGDTYVSIEVEVNTVDRTGVEMEALTACTVAALTIYDMCKSQDRTMSIEQVALWEKTGGRSGPWRRAAPDLEHDEL